MVKEKFTEQMQAYGRWKAEVSQQIQKYRDWLAAHEMSTPEDDLRIYDNLDALNSDRVMIAFAAEFSRGKTELINAIFFSDYQRRLLPSSAGRTTMCPTELFFDDRAPKPYIRLLPIETRLEDMSIAEHKQHVDHWTSIELDVTSPDEMAEAFQEIVRTKQVATEKAAMLGLHNMENLDPDNQPETVEIPVWRHALISFPHPLLKQGLVILDTPGLNAMGSEPELTMDMLPKAQAVMFILAADTGATKSDMEIWNQHAGTFRSNQQTGVLVVLNKIDALWDELHDDETIARNIAKQCQDTAKKLQVSPNHVYPVSAQKGLLARVKGDDALLVKSGLLALEATLSNDVLPAKQQIVRENIVAGIGSMVKSTHSVIKTRLDGIREQLEELRSLSGQRADVLMETMKRLRTEQQHYQKNVENFQTSRHVLKRQLQLLVEALGLENLDHLIAKTRAEMVDSWTTGGLKRGMSTFFDGARATMGQAHEQVRRSNDIVSSIYARFRDDHGFTDIKAPVYDIKKFDKELDRLFDKAEDFRNSPFTTMSEQSFVVKKFFVSLVSHARSIFFRAHEEAEDWAKNALRPLAAQIKERKTQLEQRLTNLQKIKESREELTVNISKLEEQRNDLTEQLLTIDAILKAINTPLPTLEEPKGVTAAVG
jgi:hypothetical protein